MRLVEAVQWMMGQRWDQFTREDLEDVAQTVAVRVLSAGMGDTDKPTGYWRVALRNGLADCYRRPVTEELQDEHPTEAGMDTGLELEQVCRTKAGRKLLRDAMGYPLSRRMRCYYRKQVRRS